MKRKNTASFKLPPSGRRVVVTFAEQLRAHDVTREFRRVRAQISGAGGQSFGLVVDCRGMTGYDRAARELFVKENEALREYITGVAVVTDNAMYRIVVGAMSLATRQRMKAFASMAEAEDWLQSLA